RIIDFSKNESDSEALDNMLQLSQQIFIEESVANAFNSIELYDLWLNFTKDLALAGFPEKEKAAQFALAQLEQLQLVDKTAQKFEYTLKAIVHSNDKDRYQKLNERVQAGATWFLNIINPVITATE